MNLKWDDKGLVPAVLVHAATGEVLTLAYMNREAFEKTQATRETWLYSRSRQALWHKGETSGNTQKVLSVAEDCDGDALVVRVLPDGPACHEGTRSCFRGPAGGALVVLNDVLMQRQQERPEGSYTVRLLDSENLRCKKLGEECAELVLALAKGSDAQVLDEAADLLYHLAVALRSRGISLDLLEQRLLERAT